MADEKISQLPTVTNAAVGTPSIIPIVDSVDSTTKSIALSQLDLRWGSLSQQQTNTTNISSLQTALAALVPSGSVTMFGGSSAPSGWLLCDGSAVSRTTYAALFAVLGTTYGTGDGSTTFNVPNTQGVFVRGAGSQTVGGISHSGTQGTTQGDQMQGHFHTLSPSDPVTNLVREGFANVWNIVAGSNGDLVSLSIGAPKSDGSNGTPRTGSETRPANIVLNYIIKT